MMASDDQSKSPPAPAAPTWANVNNSNRPPAIEDHHGVSSSCTTTGGASGMDDLLAPVCTLDEPVMETIMRDVRAVGGKLKAVLLPLDRNVSGHLLFVVGGGLFFKSLHYLFFVEVHYYLLL
jgi:hypothetical protein